MSRYEPPPGLSAAIEARLEGRPRAALQESARRLSEAYRARRPTQEAIRDETDALAYALTRMPATYAASMAALERLAKMRPKFAPMSLLDVGCGIGAATYAASTLWLEISDATLLDRSRAFLALARDIACDSGFEALARASFIDADLTRLPSPAVQYELVVASYALTELADDAHAKLADALWARTSDALVIVEPGTPRDYARLLQVRARLIELGATILAPCPHNAPCPLTAPDWCHFSVRLPRRRAHRLLKEAQAPFEDEKFAYLIASRTGTPAPSRIIAPPRAGKGGIMLKLCTGAGVGETFVPKRDKARYDRIRRKDWGDPTDAPVEESE